MEKFVIDFMYQGVSYSGLVSPKSENGQEGYAVRLESENQEFFLNIFANPCGEDKTDWCFMEGSGDQAYDKELLQEIGEAIEKFQTR